MTGFPNHWQTLDFKGRNQTEYTISIYSNREFDLWRLVYKIFLKNSHTKQLYQ